MGKNRQTASMTENMSITSREETVNNNYITSTGAMIDLEEYDEDFFKSLENNISAWVKYAGTPPDFLYTSDELKYILSHMENSEGDSSISNGFLTRVEKARHFTKHNYKVGDMLEDSSTFRSYSRSQEGTLEYIKRNGNPDRSIVIYRTNGNVKHFNASRFDNTYDWETESFVEQGRMRITGIHELTGDSLQNLPVELGLNKEVVVGEKLPYSITIVDVRQEN